jgi:hypothetical protein
MRPAEPDPNADALASWLPRATVSPGENPCYLEKKTGGARARPVGGDGRPDLILSMKTDRLL